MFYQLPLILKIAKKMDRATSPLQRNDLAKRKNTTKQIVNGFILRIMKLIQQSDLPAEDKKSEEFLKFVINKVPEWITALIKDESHTKIFLEIALSSFKEKLGNVR